MESFFLDRYKNPLYNHHKRLWRGQHEEKGIPPPVEGDTQFHFG